MTSSAAETDSKIQWSGFARVVLGYLDEENAKYQGYSNSSSLGQQTLLGLQADYKITDTISATGQFIARTGDAKESGLEWLYLTYEPTKALKFKLGKQRTPVFSYSDIIDVGFAYPWISLPQQVYRSFLFPTFDGLHGHYEYVGKEIVVSFEGYVGGIEEEFPAGDRVFEADIDNLRGFIGNLGYQNWNFRASYHQADVDIAQPELSGFGDQLRQLGFIQSADSLKTNGLGNFYQLSAFYENLDYFFRTEIIRLDAELILAPVTRSYFISGGYNFYPFLVYASLSKDINRYSKPNSDIPVGIAPQIDALAFGYQQIFGQLTDNSTKSYTAGIRWDWRENIAFKAEASLLESSEGNQAFFEVINPNEFDQKAALYQLAIEWVF